MTRDRLRADVLYYVRDVELYAYSPDGWGVIWYDTFEESYQNVGLDHYTTIAELADY